MAARRYTSPAIVIRVRPFGETSQVLHLATPDHGLVPALAKGAHRPGPAFHGGVALASAGTAHLLRRPRAELELIRRFVPNEDLRGLRDALPRFYAACYAIELLRAWMRPALPAPSLFRAALTALRAMARAPAASLGTWVAWFEARALAAAGHRPRLEACAVCGEAVDGRVLFSPPAGGLVHRGCAPPGPRLAVQAEDARALERLYTIRLKDLARDPPEPAAVGSARAMHDVFIPYVLERRPAALAGLPGRR